jgi:PLP dependent protein
MEPPINETVADRVRLVLSNIRRAAERAGRPVQHIRLVAVTKTVTLDRIQQGLDAGLAILGESRLQEAVPKITALGQAAAKWHFIGHLQRRKVASVIGVFDLIHSVDTVALAQDVNRRAAAVAHSQDVLLEVNIGNEPAKTGFRLDEIVDVVPGMAALSHIRIRGLMAIPPPVRQAEQARPYFRHLRALAARIQRLGVPTIAMDELSMGMSNDYEVAIEEGATLVRIGTAIFGARHA